MLATLIPLFNNQMQVRAYSLFSQKRNKLLQPALLGSGQNDGAVNVEGLEVIQSIGIDTLSPDADIFLPVGNIAVFSSLEAQCGVLVSRITLLFDYSIVPEDSYVKRLKQLKEAGFKLAMYKLPIADFENYRAVLELMDYFILDCKKTDVDKALFYFSRRFPSITLCAGNIDSQTQFDILREKVGLELFEGNFYRLPVDLGNVELTPLKVNYLQLLELINAPDFDLQKVADVIGRDTAMVVSLLEMVNKISVNSEITSIRHAAAMLGQKELRKWINTVITKELCSERPSEIMRLSLLRAKFMELLAPMFELRAKSSELFLTGLFSVLDLILNLPLAEALDRINISKEIRQALLQNQGELAEVYHMLLCYENADWQEISRQMIIMNQSDNMVYQAYIESVKWYRNLFFK